MAKLKAPFALDRSLNTTEQTSRNIADVLAEELSAIITALGGLNFINYEVVEELPTTGISTTTIYLVPSDDPQSGNTYDEYINLNGTVSGWEKIGSTAIDLSGYYTSAETDALLDEKVDKDSFDEQTATDEFSTINGGLLSALKVALSPNQDLHGYDHPWVGGAGKNKLPLVLADIKADNTSGTWNGNVYTKDGIDFTILTDDADNVLGIKVNGTATVQVGITINYYTPISAGNYILNGAPSGSGWSSTWLNVNTDGTNYNDIGSGASFTASVDTTFRTFCYVASGATVSNKVFLPMIRLATESDPTFEPYSNICPIRGHTQVDVDVSDGDTTQEQVTVNLGGTYYSGTLDVVTGVFTPDTAKYVLTDISAIEEFTANAQYGSFGKIKASEYPSIKEDISLELSSSCKAVLYVNRISDIHDNRFYINDINRVYIRANVDENVTTVNELFAIFENCEFVMPLANPTPIQLSPTTVKALVGENHLSAPLDGQEITESKYRELFTWDEVEAYVNAHSGGGSGMNYSTEEQVVGTWIDGKTLYQKTWDFSGSPVMLSYADWVNSGISASENIKSIISAELKYGVVNLASVEVGVNVDGYPIGFQKLDNLNTRGVTYCTLRYTKTTD